MRQRCVYAWACALLVLAPLHAEEVPVAQEEHGFWTKALWYVPNRVIDFVDIFRLRFKAGPGFGAGVRLTDYAAFYLGSEDTAWIGLPGGRYPEEIRLPWGRDERHGIVLMGVDASDDTPHPPNYGVAEVGASVHLGIAGVDAGVDLVEFVDFFAGFLGKDPREDDFPQRKKISHEKSGSVLLPQLTYDNPNLVDKPHRFTSTDQRLFYLRDQTPHRIGRSLQSFDEQFVVEGENPLPQPIIEDMQLAIHLRTLHGASSEMSVKPKIKLHIDLPNLERSVKLFVTSSYDEELPGRDFDEVRDRGWTIGAQRSSPRRNTYTDVGIHTKIPPKLFVRTGWRPRWTWGKWFHQFDQRAFWESDDRVGVLTSQHIYRWVAPKWIVRSLTAGRYAERTEGYEWQQSLGVVHISKLSNENKRTEFASASDALSCIGLDTTVFGSDDATTQVKSVVVYRRTLHRDFLVFEFTPGVQWRDQQNWDIEYRVDCGIVFFF